ncbi:hypothetical protein GCM10009765_68550 [Fodinicola feengrottensis]|uniref:Uncharacterized protein n=1 Tax=Fodinicola feengrottensis TaxID=435914 RepID=A0ABN2IQ37_9ACTN
MSDSVGGGDPFNHFTSGPMPREKPPEAKDDGAVGANPTPPEVTVVDSWFAPSATGDIKESDPGNGGQKPPDVPKFAVTVQTLRDAELALKSSIDQAAATYKNLKDTTNLEKGWVFQQSSATSAGHTETHNSINSIQSGPTTDTTSPLPELAKQTPKMIAGLDSALLSIADAIHMTGNYAARLNDAVQIYTKADKDSFLPLQ